MIYAIIVAGGSGSRMGKNDLPKQFLTLKEKPIIVRTAEKFCSVSSIDKILILCPEAFLDLTKDIFNKYLPKSKNLIVLGGEKTRNETIMKGIAHIEATDGIDDNTVIITHDAVRPFVSQKIIEKSIEASKKFSAVGTAVPVTDTIFESENSAIVTNIPDRNKFYSAQTPQTFNARLFKEIYSVLSENEKEGLTDACKIFALKGYEVHIINGERKNIKITYPIDLKIAEAILEEEINESSRN